MLIALGQRIEWGTASTVKRELQQGHGLIWGEEGGRGESL